MAASLAASWEVRAGRVGTVRASHRGVLTWASANVSFVSNDYNSGVFSQLQSLDYSIVEPQAHTLHGFPCLSPSAVWRPLLPIGSLKILPFHCWGFALLLCALAGETLVLLDYPNSGSQRTDISPEIPCLGEGHGKAGPPPPPPHASGGMGATAQENVQHSSDHLLGCFLGQREPRQWRIRDGWGRLWPGLLGTAYLLPSFKPKPLVGAVKTDLEVIRLLCLFLIPVCTHWLLFVSLIGVLEADCWLSLACWSCQVPGSDPCNSSNEFLSPARHCLTLPEVSTAQKVFLFCFCLFSLGHFRSYLSNICTLISWRIPKSGKLGTEVSHLQLQAGSPSVVISQPALPEVERDWMETRASVRTSSCLRGWPANAGPGWWRLGSSHQEVPRKEGHRGLSSIPCCSTFSTASGHRTF